MIPPRPNSPMHVLKRLQTGLEGCYQSQQLQLLDKIRKTQMQNAWYKFVQSHDFTKWQLYSEVANTIFWRRK
ncbi:hypothetical protein FGO68_gene13237 [Halteria grandinella]|uniref:Uncharacterized protein n=1 Tax=Halteria grandinella TaxID=5974 RepID=A0A8J8NG01_HALGN|nr:hypothetical protein FGO68_gene13237 [Halteria grandinella]